MRGEVRRENGARGEGEPTTEGGSRGGGRGGDFGGGDGGTLLPHATQRLGAWRRGNEREGVGRGLGSAGGGRPAAARCCRRQRTELRLRGASAGGRRPPPTAAGGVAFGTRQRRGQGEEVGAVAARRNLVGPL